MNPRLLAVLSALCSLAFLVGLALGGVVLFFNWKLGLAFIAVALVLAPTAKWLDKRKAMRVWGRQVGEGVHGVRWAQGNKGAVAWGAVEASMFKDYGPIFKLYGTDLGEEDTTALMCIHRFIQQGRGEWSSVVETDGQEYPCFSILIKSFPYMLPAGDEEEDPALLIVTMDKDRNKVLDYSLNRPPHKGAVDSHD